MASKQSLNAKIQQLEKESSGWLSAFKEQEKNNKIISKEFLNVCKRLGLAEKRMELAYGHCDVTLLGDYYKEYPQEDSETIKG